MSSLRSRLALLLLVAFLANCDGIDVSPTEVCRLREITLEDGNIRGPIPAVLFDYNEWGQITRIGNHVWEQVDVRYENGTVKNVQRMSFHYLNPAIDTVSFDFTYQQNLILVTRTLLRNGPDTLLERLNVYLDAEGKITKLQRRTPADHLNMEFHYTWSNGNITEVNAYDSLGQHRIEAIYEYDSYKNPLIQVGYLLVDPIWTSANNFMLRSFRDPLTGFEATFFNPIGGSSTAQGFPEIVRSPLYAPGRNLGRALYEHCE